MGKGIALPTIWEIPVHSWEPIRLVILEIDPLKFTGREHFDSGLVLDGVEREWQARDRQQSTVDRYHNEPWGSSTLWPVRLLQAGERTVERARTSRTSPTSM